MSAQHVTDLEVSFKRCAFVQWDLGMFELLCALGKSSMITQLDTVGIEKDNPLPVSDPNGKCARHECR